jgi:hypothetical protein
MGLIPFVPLVAAFCLALLLSWPNFSRATLTVSGTGLQGDTNITLDTNGTLGVGTASATAITIGQSSLNVSIPGSLTVSSATTTVNNLHVIGSCLGCGLSSAITAINGLGNTTISLVAGTNITIATSSPSVITISASVATTTPAGSNTQLQFDNSGAFGASPNLTWLSPALTIGQTGTTTGQLKLAGATSGTVTVQASSTAGSWTLTLPSSVGTAGYVLSTDGSGNTSWIAQSGGASIVVNGLTNSSFQFNGTANQITVATSSSNTITWGLPQNINTTAAPTFGGLTVSGTATASALTISGITGSTQCLHVNTNGTVSGTGSDCGTGSSNSPSWYKYAVSYTALTANATTQAVTILTLPARSKMTGITVECPVTFTAQLSMSLLTVSIGGAGGATDFTNPFVLINSSSPITCGSTYYLDNGGNTSGVTMAAQNITANFTSTGLNLGNGTATNLTAGTLSTCETVV